MSGEYKAVYTHGHHESVLRSHRVRTAENSAAYLLPHLRPGCPCSTSAADPARSPSTSPPASHLDRSSPSKWPMMHWIWPVSRRTAGQANIEFVASDVHALVFPDDTFDVVHAHQVLQHVADPVQALREMRRVCKPGGMVAARDADYGGFTWFPQLPALDQWMALYPRPRGPTVASPTRAGDCCRGRGTPGSTTSRRPADCGASPRRRPRDWWGGMWADRIVESALARQLVDCGLATAAELEEIAEAWRQWAAAPDGWIGIPHGEILCRA